VSLAWRHRAHIEHESLGDEIGEQKWILDRADPVADAVAVSASIAPRMDAGPAASPAWGTDPKPPSFAIANAGS
jgi:hypothetical protein